MAAGPRVGTKFFAEEVRAAVGVPTASVFDDERTGSGRRTGVSGGVQVRTGVLLIGTAATVRQLCSQLSAMERPPVIAGAVIVGATQPVALPVPVLGTTDDLPVLAPRFQIKLGLVCLPAGMNDGSVSLAVRAAGIPLREIPAMEDILSGTITGGTPVPPDPVTPQNVPSHRFAGASPSVDLGALIGRKPYEMDRDAVSRVLRGKRVIITGAGGSIGAELARVAAAFEPSLLVLMERAENALFEIDRQIATHYPKLRRRAVLHDVVDAEATLRLCEEIQPHAVFHSAAHKHVPLMEDHPAHAVTNNLFGTKSIADAAIACGAERFVMISSDKAVNPTSVMGATKRLAEMYVRGIGERSEVKTRLSMVRFGNVLGSNASVLTIWAQQIAEGGPITITDPRMTRFFMTIPEAATLVVQSTVLGAQAFGIGHSAFGAEGSKSDRMPNAERRMPTPDSPVGVFVLDMGEPIRIVDLAVRFAKAHGLEARLDSEPSTLTQGLPSINLVFNGIRPGEKIHEELAYAAEQLRPTAHPGIRSWAGPGFEPETAGRVRQMVADLHAARFSQDRAAVLAAIKKHVPEMRPGPGTMGGGDSDSAQAVHPNVG